MCMLGVLFRQGVPKAVEQDGVAFLGHGMGDESEGEQLACFKDALGRTHIASKGYSILAAFAEVMSHSSDGEEATSQLAELELGIARPETVFTTSEQSKGSPRGVPLVHRQSEGLVTENGPG